MIQAVRRRAGAGLVLALLCLALPAAAKQPDYPALSGRVVDQAGILSAEIEGQLTGWLEGLETETGKQAVVATVKSLDGLEIEEYGVGLGRKWGIGQKDKDTGIILLVAPNDRQVRFEVGYGLEGEMTDAQSRAIIEQQIIPSFKQGNYETGIVNGTAAMLNVLGWKGAPQAVAEPIPGPGPAGGVDWIPFIYFGMFFLVVIFRMIFGRRGRRGLWSTTSSGWGGGGWSGGGGFSSGGGGFSGGGGSFGGGGASGRW